MKNNENQLASKIVEQLRNADDNTTEKITGEFVALMASKHQIHRMKGVIAAIEHAWEKVYGRATITVETAYPLSSAQRAKIIKSADGAELKERVDSDLIGGARVRIDNRILDGSVKGLIDQLEKVFNE